MVKLILSILTSVTLLNCNPDYSKCEKEHDFLSKLDSLTHSATNNSWYIQNCKNLNEPVLGQQNHEAYRLMIIQNLGVYKTVYRLENIFDKFVLTSKLFLTLDLDSSFNEILLKDTTVEISKRKWNNFKNLLNESCFWNMHPKQRYALLDGTNWILEASRVKGDKFSNRTQHYIARNLHEGDFKLICEELIKLSPLKTNNLNEELEQNVKKALLIKNTMHNTTYNAIAFPLIK